MPASKEFTIIIREDIKPAFTAQIIAAAYDAFPELYMPDSVGLPNRTFPHEKYLMWRLGADALEDVLVLEKTVIHWDRAVAPEITVTYHINTQYCAEHRTYMSSEDPGAGYPHYFATHGWSEDKFLETRNW